MDCVTILPTHFVPYVCWIFRLFYIVFYADKVIIYCRIVYLRLKALQNCALELRELDLRICIKIFRFYNTQ